VSDDPILRAADAVGGLIEAWGFKRNMGRLWCVLYLEPKPLSAAELCERLSLSTGAVSMTLSDLSQWGVVKKTWVPGERREYYEPETSIWKCVSNVFRQRELQLIRGAIESFENAVTTLSGQPRVDQFAIDRIRALTMLAHTAQRLLSSILAGESVDASPIAAFRGSTESGGQDKG
jgi:DNA-binding transcriptional regulator GbsR (MarR family)